MEKMKVLKMMRIIITVMTISQVIGCSGSENSSQGASNTEKSISVSADVGEEAPDNAVRSESAIETSDTTIEAECVTEIEDNAEALESSEEIISEEVFDTEKRETEDAQPENISNNLSITSANLAISMLQAQEGENKLVSPISVIMAMGMAANGAENETRAEILSALNMDIDTLNSSVNALISKDDTSEIKQVHYANGIWINGEDQLKDSFIEAMKSYKAQISEQLFTADTVHDINTFVNENTDGQIEKLIEELPLESSMVLVDALSFDGKWVKPFEDNNIDENGKFTTIDGNIQNACMLLGNAYDYIELNGSTGFTYDYQGGEYTFVAMLPTEGESISDFIQNLTGEDIINAYNNKVSCKVNIGIPEFDFDYDMELKDMFKSLGVSRAFEVSGADFSGMYFENTPTYISSIIHKTHIELNREGTKAAATTGVMVLGTAMTTEEEIKEVILDRPFIYLIIDKAQNVPIFVGQVDSLN